jgi:ABC-type spermidine/putrescine transport system permease subunit II
LSAVILSLYAPHVLHLAYSFNQSPHRFMKQYI